MSVFSDRLRELRSEFGKKQADIASILGVSIQSYSAFETGREPKYDVLVQLANYFDVTTDYLTGNSDHKTIANSNIGQMTGLSDDAIKSIEQIREAGMNDTFNKLVVNINFIAAFYALKHIPEQKYSPHNYYCILEQEHFDSFASGEKRQANIIPGHDLINSYVANAKEKLLAALSEVAHQIEYGVKKE